MKTWRLIWHDILVRCCYFIAMLPFTAAGFVWSQARVSFSVGFDAGDKFMDWVIKGTKK